MSIFAEFAADLKNLGNSVSNLAGNVAPTTSKPPAKNPLDHLPTPPDISQSTRLLVALAASSAATSNPGITSSDARLRTWWATIGGSWLGSVCTMIKIDSASLPSLVPPQHVKDASEEHFKDMTKEEKIQEWKSVVKTLVIASVFSGPLEGERIKKIKLGEKEGASSSTTAQKDTESVPTLSYTAPARALIFTTLQLLSIPTAPYLSDTELELSRSLFSTLQEVTAQAAKEETEAARQKAQEGWGGKTGRMLATGAGIVVGGVALGVTGGLAAPAMIALIPSALSFGLLTTATAPVVLGGVLGVYGGGLAGKRVRERWRGVAEFEFIDVKPGSHEIEHIPGTPSTLPQDEEDTDPAARKSMDGGNVARRDSLDGLSLPGAEKDAPPAYTPSTPAKSTPPISPIAPTSPTFGEDVMAVTEKVRRTSLEYGDNLRKSTLSTLGLDDWSAASLKKAYEGRRASVASIESSTSALGSQSMSGEDEKAALKGPPPSLTATIIVPGLLTKSQTEALTSYQQEIVPICFGDGRDVYILKYETKVMYAAGKAMDGWVTGKFKGYLKGQIIKRTLLSAYFAAVSLPKYVYGTATQVLDNVWMQAVDKSRKAGILLGEVLEKRVQGQRPVILIGSSTGALTIFEALLYLSKSSSAEALPQIVESVYLISLPTAPTAAEWAACRSVVARRVVNAWCGTDLVLAGVVRMHEVVSRAMDLQDGIRVAGLAPASQPGIEDVCLNKAISGHLQIQQKMKEILEIINVDGEKSDHIVSEEEIEREEKVGEEAMEKEQKEGSVEKLGGEIASEGKQEEVVSKKT